MSKFFLVNPDVQSLSKRDINHIEKKKISKKKEIWEQREESMENAVKSYVPLKHTRGRVIVVVNTEYKNYVKLNDSKIRLERQFNNLNRRETEPVNAIVVDAENIPSGAEILVHHNSLHDSYRVFGAEKLVDGETSADVKYYSINESDCFLWRINNSEWHPCTVFATALRVFTPYKGSLENVPHTKLKDVLYCTSGVLKGQAVSTLKGCDYEVIFNNEKFEEERVIRFRPFGDEPNNREPEAIALLDNITLLINNGELYVGLTDKDCKQINK